jgi:NAD(P)-dependent dehydrogenase (short-subunit alcohol dehydrogenase family)
MTTATRTIVMTGATRGIGLEAAKNILQRSPETHLAIFARESSGVQVLPDLLNLSPHVSVIGADLANKASVDAAASEAADLLDDKVLPPLRGIVCNAGVHLHDALHTTDDGYEITFGVNVVATHLVLKRLHSRLQRPARIVVTVSDAHFGDLRHTGGTMPPPQWTDPQTVSRPGAFTDDPASIRAGRRAYVTSKLGGIYLVHEWARRLPVGADIVAYNPSLVLGTGLARDAGSQLQFAMKWIVPAFALTPLVETPPTAGRKLADAVLGDTRADTGTYIHRTRAMASSKESYNPGREGELWEWLEEQ